MHVTIHDIARKSRVSIATVSRVLNRNPHVDEKTKASVINAIKSLNYKPNLLARGLITKKSNVIGLVVTPGLKFFASHYFSDILHGIVAEAENCGYDVLLKIYHDEKENNFYEHIWEMKRCDGLLIVAPIAEDKNIKNIEKRNIPVVLLNSVSDTLGYIDVDNIDGAVQATEHLIQLGHSRIAIINGFMGGSNGTDRFYGYKTALQKYKIKLEDKYVAYGEFNHQGGYNAMKKLLETDPRPTAVFSANDAMAFGALQAIQEKGLKIPKDISIVGFDDIFSAAYCNPPLTTLRQPTHEMGKGAVRMLVNQMKNAKRIFEKILLKPKLVVRKSTGKLGRRKDRKGSL